MTIADLLLLLRQRLIIHLSADNREELYALYTTFTVLKETLYNSENKSLIRLIVDMESAAQDGTMGVKGKNPVPSNKEIQAACSLHV